MVAESRRSKGYPILQYVRLTGRSAPRCGGVYGSVHKVAGFGVWFKQGFSLDRLKPGFSWVAEQGLDRAGFK